MTDKECMDACQECIKSCDACCADNAKECESTHPHSIVCAEFCALVRSLTEKGICPKEVYELGAKICEKCAEECGKIDNQSTKSCATACKKCAESCRACHADCKRTCDVK